VSERPLFAEGTLKTYAHVAGVGMELGMSGKWAVIRYWEGERDVRSQKNLTATRSLNSLWPSKV
jgi:hypothetical protein